MNSTCFSDKLMSQLAKCAEDLAPGTFVITTTRTLPSEAFEVLEECCMTESWGDATTYSKCVSGANGEKVLCWGMMLHACI